MIDDAWTIWRMERTPLAEASDIQSIFGSAGDAGAASCARNPTGLLCLYDEDKSISGAADALHVVFYAAIGRNLSRYAMNQFRSDEEKSLI
jgi:hypothetical protein